MDEFGFGYEAQSAFTNFLIFAGDSPFEAMWFLFRKGGWVLLAWLGWIMFTQLWLNARENAYNAAKEWILLAIEVPRLTEQTPRAVENIFAHFAGAHGPSSWTEKWIQGRTQDTITVELVSIEGRVQYMVHTTRGFRDLIEASIYSQYPDAKITEVEDYTLTVPSNYPDPEWDLFGIEMIPVKPDTYPLRTYHDFTDQISGELKDPLAVLLEDMSRLGPGEQAWYQIVLTPIEQSEFRKRGEALVKKLTGEKVTQKETTTQKILNAPLKAIGIVFETLGLTSPPAPKKEAGAPRNQVLYLTPGERKVVEAVEQKMSKIVHQAKIRFIYVGKKTVMKKSRIVHPFIGSIKQYNTNDMQSLKPESKKVGVNGALLLFKDRRNNTRKRKLISAYRKRSNWLGTPNYVLNIEELASLWHFPITMQTQAPQLRKTEVKHAEPPMNVPFE